MLITDGIMSVMRARAAIYFLALPLIAFQPAKRMPYTALNDPEFVAASAATFLADDDRLIGLISGNCREGFVGVRNELTYEGARN